jgi:hypothetical protein
MQVLYWGLPRRINKLQMTMKVDVKLMNYIIKGSLNFLINIRKIMTEKPLREEKNNSQISSTKNILEKKL